MPNTKTACWLRIADEVAQRRIHGGKEAQGRVEVVAGDEDGRFLDIRERLGKSVELALRSLGYSEPFLD